MTADAAAWSVEAASAHLCSVDARLREVIERTGPLQPRTKPDLWRALVEAIVGQQLSVRAAATIAGRVADLGHAGSFPSADQLRTHPEEALRGCGLSRPKARYIRDLAERWSDGTLEPHRLPELDDDEVIGRLTEVKGIGRWTAEMVLIFSLGRPDVLPVDDLGLRTAVQHAYGLEERPAKAEVERIGGPWRPYRSAATLWLWQSLKKTPEVGS